MLLLVTHGHPTMLRYNDAHLGRLVQPRHYSSIKATAETGIPWAADNDAFGGWDAERRVRYIKMLDHLEGVPGGLFVALPDVVGDAKQTSMMFSEWLPSLKERGLPVALVAQDGIEELGVPWDSIDALFIGGTTEFKLGMVAQEFGFEAKRRGKWLHMGRVNSLKRIRYAASIGCDSVDGSSFARFSKTWIPQGLGAMKAGRQIVMADPCPTCHGTDPEGGTVPIAGPDENGQYDTDDCPDGFHSWK